MLANTGVNATHELITSREHVLFDIPKRFRITRIRIARDFVLLKPPFNESNLIRNFPGKTLREKTYHLGNFFVVPVKAHPRL